VLGLIEGLVGVLLFVSSYVLPIAVGYLTDPFGRIIESPRQTSAWQPSALVVNSDGSAPTDAQLKVSSPQDLAPLGVTLPNPQAPSTQAPAPTATIQTPSGGTVNVPVKTRTIGAQQLTLTPQQRAMQGIEGNYPALTSSDPNAPSTVPAQGIAATPVATSATTPAGQYIGVDGTLIASPQSAPVPGNAAAAQSSAGQTSSTLTKVLSSPIAVTGGAAALAGIGFLFDRFAARSRG
jgi:hypothetical protein